MSTSNGGSVEVRPLDALIPYARNSRTHSEAQVGQIAASIDEFGWTSPILADDRGIVAGHGRALGAAKLYAAGKLIYPCPGRECGAEPFPPGTVPVIDCTGWPETKRRAYVIADNKLALNAGWDEELLKLELHAIAEDDEALLALTGFAGDELSRAMFDDPPGEDDDEEPGEGEGGNGHSCPNCGYRLDK